MNKSIFDQGLVTQQVTLGLGRIQEGIVKVNHEEYGYTWLPITVIRNLQLLKVTDSQGLYSIDINEDYWNDIFWID